MSVAIGFSVCVVLVHGEVYHAFALDAMLEIVESPILGNNKGDILLFLINQNVPFSASQRYAQHILPARMQRIRYAGLFRAQGMEARLEECRAALGDYRKSAVAGQSNQSKPPPSQWREDEDESDGADDSTEVLCECGQPMQSAMRIDPAPTMSMIGFVEKTVDRTLPQLLGAVLSRLLMELDQPHSRRRFCDRLKVYGLELEALRVFLSEALPIKEEENDNALVTQTHEHLSGIPPPCTESTDDDGTVIGHA